MENKRIPSGKEYHIDSFEKMVNIVTDENISDFIMDFATWLKITLDISNQLRRGKTLSAKEKKMNNWDLLSPTFIWKDDGKNDFTKVIIKNPKTGEKVTVSGKMPNIPIDETTKKA